MLRERRDHQVQVQVRVLESRWVAMVDGDGG